MISDDIVFVPTSQELSLTDLLYDAHIRFSYVPPNNLQYVLLTSRQLKIFNFL